MPATTTADMFTSLAARVVQELAQRRPHFVATYRLQFHPGFTFYDAARIVPYLRELGISHVYASPYLRPRSGSHDGYSVCDPNALNPELGGAEGFSHYVQALQDHGLAQILDFVPNHMAASMENPWWFDVLENGPSSPYAQFFDIDWEPVTSELRDKLLLPVLGQQYGKALEDGQLQLNREGGAFFVRYYETNLPLAPETVVAVLTHRLEHLALSLGESAPELIELQSVITALRHLPPQTSRAWQLIQERQREKEVIKHRLAALIEESNPIAAFLDENIRSFNGVPHEPASFDLLDELLTAQPYRLCYWRAAADEINYRRFFDINELTALCMENPDVFWNSHLLVRKLLADGAVCGLRIDHIDGLYNPRQYLWRLQWAHVADIAQRLQAESDPKIDWRQHGACALQACLQALQLPVPGREDLRAVLGPEADLTQAPATTPDAEYRVAGGRQLPLFVIAEKILGPEEPLPESWPLAGTTGYDGLNLINGLLVAPEGWRSLVRSFQRLLPEDADFDEVVHDAKLLILRASMASELQMLAHRLSLISEQHRRSRDFTLNMLRHLLREVLACFPIYRVYPEHSGVSERDRKFVDVAIAKAKRRDPTLDPALIDFLRRVLLLQHPEGLSDAAIQLREFFAGRFQQVASPVMAKGVEDTTFYIYVPLVSINEVGSHPAQPLTTPDEFHRDNTLRQSHHCRSLVATSTHDTKRSEDVRARIHVLSEVPRLWHNAVQRWFRINKRHRREVDGEAAPSPKDEYLYYQALIGLWPAHTPSTTERLQLVARLQAYMEKATHEAKQRTSWIHPNANYDAAVRDFIAGTLEDASENSFVPGLREFLDPLLVAGQLCALSQLALKLLSPGVPDIYQGQEWWDYSLVDPDNRRPVDFDAHSQLLDTLLSYDRLPASERLKHVHDWLAKPHAPMLKQFVTHTLLKLRREQHDVFEAGTYEPLSTTGPLADYLVSFGWRKSNGDPLSLVAIVPRFWQKLRNLPGRPGNAILPPAECWGNTKLALPQPIASGENVFTRQRYIMGTELIEVGPLLTDFPLAILACDAS